MGPTKCEYCGKANAEECVSNLPEEFYDRLMMAIDSKINCHHHYKQRNSSGGGGGGGVSLSVRQPTKPEIANDNSNGIIMEYEDYNDDSKTKTNKLHTLKTAQTTTNLAGASTKTTANTTTPTLTNTKTTTIANPGTTPLVCPRPKLFFLKKRPPFAQSDGWNPNTEYRMNLFEPPSSVEGMGRGKKEVRGHLGSTSSNSGTGATTAAAAAAVTNNNGMVMIGAKATTRARSTATATTTIGRGGGVSLVMNNGANTNPLNQSSGGGGGSEMMIQTETSFSSIDCSTGGGAITSKITRSYSPVQWIRGWVGGSSPPSSL